MPTHKAWGSIGLFHNVVRTMAFLHERDGMPLPKVCYRAKVKLHGTNCAVQVQEDGVFAQSRTGMLTLPSGDRKGFARWVEDHRAYWENLAPGTVVFGEWCGPGIEKGMAISQVSTKVFAVFAIQQGESLINDPLQLAALLPTGAPTNLHVLPWYKTPIVVDYAHRGALDLVVATISAWVLEVETEDPWVKKTFGVSGVGEGLVFYPVGEHSTGDPAELSLLMFKAKGEKHRSAGTKKAVQVDAEVVASVDEFSVLMVTDARLQQGVSEACGGVLEMRRMGKLLQWVTADVQKESVAELEASGLTWQQVVKAVQARAREWYKARVLESTVG
jgi:hypothetical protein